MIKISVAIYVYIGIWHTNLTVPPVPVQSSTPRYSINRSTEYIIHATYARFPATSTPHFVLPTTAAVVLMGSLITTGHWSYSLRWYHIYTLNVYHAAVLPFGTQTPSDLGVMVHIPPLSDAPYVGYTAVVSSHNPIPHMCHQTGQQLHAAAVDNTSTNPYCCLVRSFHGMLLSRTHPPPPSHPTTRRL